MTTDFSFQDVPKKFRYYAKSLLKITPAIDKIVKDETITSGVETADEDSGSSKSDDKFGATQSSKEQQQDLPPPPSDKNVLPTPPGKKQANGSPEETVIWKYSLQDGIHQLTPSLPPPLPPPILPQRDDRRTSADLKWEDQQGYSSNSSSDDDEDGKNDNEEAIDLIKKAELSESKNTVVIVSDDSYHHHGVSPFIADDLDNPIIARALARGIPKRHRGEKKPIPCEQKDDKYFERRKRNNQAAKKSRDARKAREDQIAIRANLLEKENAILRAQVSTLRDEANSLRQLLLQKRNNNHNNSRA